MSPFVSFALSLLVPVNGWVIAQKIKVHSNVPLTPALRTATDEKLGKQLERYEKYLHSVDVDLKVEHRALHDTEHRGREAHIAVVTAYCQDKQVIRVSHESDDMYASIDLLADQLARKLRKYKERRTQRQHARVATAEVFHDTGAQEEEPEEEIPPRTAAAAAAVGPSLAPEAPEPPLEGVWQLVREKRFAMPPITVDEAIVCLNYVDHNFYVFRNVESGEINVIYQRAEGGIGWIQPTDEAA